MHEEQSKYQVWGVKYWNYDELSLAIQNLPTGVQELASLSDISTSTTQSVFCIWFFYTLGWEKKMTVRGKHTPHARSDSLELKCSTQKEQQNRRLCIASRENRVLRVLDRATTHTHTHSNTHHTHTEKSRSVKYLNYFTWLLYLSIIWGNLHFSRVQFKQKTCTCP